MRTAHEREKTMSATGARAHAPPPAKSTSRARRRARGRLAARAAFALLLAALLPAPAEASLLDWIAADVPVELGGTKVISQDTYRLLGSERERGDTYVSAREVNVAGTIAGDLSVLALERLEMNGVVEEDLNAASSSVKVNGQVGDDLRAAALVEISIDGPVGGDAFLVSSGGAVTFYPEAEISGALAVFSGTVVLRGRVDGPVRITAGSVVLDGEIGGNARIVCDELKVGPGARILGDLVYDARNEVHGLEQFVSGTVQRAALRQPGTSADSFFEIKLPDFGIWPSVYLAAVALLAGLLLLIFFGPLVEGMLAHAGSGSGFVMSFAIGLVTLLVSLVLSILCLPAFPLAFALWAALIALSYVGSIVGKLILGQLLLKPLFRGGAHPLLALLVGVLVMFGLGLIPVAGNLISVLVMITGVGATMLSLRDVRSGHDEAAVQPSPPPAAGSATAPPPYAPSP